MKYLTHFPSLLFSLPTELALNILIHFLFLPSGSSINNTLEHLYCNPPTNLEGSVQISPWESIQPLHYLLVSPRNNCSTTAGRSETLKGKKHQIFLFLYCKQILGFQSWMMGWRYKAGLFLIAAVVIIWVTSAEVTQVKTLSLFPKKFNFLIHWFLALSFSILGA